jgi:GT2 family glycosyltransferase
VVFLLFNAERDVRGLVEALRRQEHPRFSQQGDWLEALFMDDASRDGTVRVLEECLGEIGSPAYYRTVVNPENLGLAATYNKALALVLTPYVLTCHLDCRFGREDYVAAMLDLLERHPEAGAITGQPTVPDLGQGSFAEKLNVVTNLMDVFPPVSDQEVVSVGFAEGRCDGFRMDALRAAGFYDTNLRTAGEDQVLAARLRARGYQVYQAPSLPYVLSVSGEQDSLRRLARHQRLFGRAHPYILLRAPGSGPGVIGERAGANRRRRALLRLVQIGSTGVYAFVLAALAAGWPAWLPLSGLALVVAAKASLFGRHLRTVPFAAGERLAFWIVQPLLDASYTVGLAQGAFLLLGGKHGRPIE